MSISNEEIAELERLETLPTNKDAKTFEEIFAEAKAFNWVMEPIPRLIARLRAAESERDTLAEAIVNLAASMGKTIPEGMSVSSKAEDVVTTAMRRMRDDPEADGTDAAHPAWWRGNDAGAMAMIRVVNETLDNGRGSGARQWAIQAIMVHRLEVMWKQLQANRWIPVAERLPEEQKSVLVWQGNPEHQYWPWVIATLISGKWFNDVSDDYVALDKVTHWRPIVGPEGAK